jgi:hypothetical protein
MEEGKRSSTPIWLAVALVAIAFTLGLSAVAGFLLGHFTGGTTTTTVAVEGGGSEAGGTTSSEPGAQVFTASGCGNCHTFAAAASRVAFGDLGFGVDDLVANSPAE